MSVIVKTSLQGDFAFDTLSAMNVYEKEIEFYDKIAPLIRKTLHDASISEQLLAETYGVNTTNNAMLFEDLLVKGYRLVPIKQGKRIHKNLCLKPRKRPRFSHFLFFKVLIWKKPN